MTPGLPVFQGSDTSAHSTDRNPPARHAAVRVGEAVEPQDPPAGLVWLSRIVVRSPALLCGEADVVEMIAVVLFVVLVLEVVVVPAAEFAVFG